MTKIATVTAKVKKPMTVSFDVRYYSAEHYIKSEREGEHILSDKVKDTVLEAVASLHQKGIEPKSITIKFDIYDK